MQQHTQAHTTPATRPGTHGATPPSLSGWLAGEGNATPAGLLCVCHEGEIMKAGRGACLGADIRQWVIIAFTWSSTVLGGSVSFDGERGR